MQQVKPLMLGCFEGHREGSVIHETANLLSLQVPVLRIEKPTRPQCNA